jgi:hypothetical protein
MHPILKILHLLHDKEYRMTRGDLTEQVASEDDHRSELMVELELI